jgi:FAD/FMN-containing dehydrogenase
MLTRRNFLLSGAAGLSALAIRPASAESAPTPPDRWEMLRRVAGEGLVRQGETGFDGLALPNNLRFGDVRPEGVVRVTSPQMVSDVLNWCLDYDVPFAIRGGGHSYAGYSSGRDLVIDMGGMTAISYNDADETVTVEAGALNGDVYQALAAKGRTITHGRCPSVGVAGYLLGGGIGFNMRRFGMGCDAVLGSSLVTADGALRHLSAESEPDLFWATRGGAGGNFGISTSFTLKTHAADERLTVYRLVWRDRTLDVATKLFETLDAAPETLGTRVALGGVNPTTRAQGRQVPLTLLGQFAGSREDFLKLMAPVYGVGAPGFSDIEEVPYWEGQEFLAEEGEPGYFRERSAFFTRAPDREFLGAAIEAMEDWPGTGASANLVFFQTGGAVNALGAGDTAFVHRDSRWLSTANLVWSEDDAARPDVVRRATEWQDRLYGLVIAGDTKGAFQNFPDPSLTDWRARYYGENLARLEAIKAAVDPTNVFRFGQSI